MGQYYAPVIFDKKLNRRKSETIEAVASLDSHRLGNGLKLMESAWVGNNYVNAIMFLLAGPFKGYPFAMIGDYADTIDNTANTENGCDSEKDNGTVNGYKLSTDGLCEQTLALIPTKYYAADPSKKYDYDNNGVVTDNPYKYIVNVDKNEYVEVEDIDEELLQIHPLTILCAYGNGRGGGDYHGLEDKPETQKNVGRWAFDRIIATNDKPEPPCKLLNPQFRDSWADEFNAKVLAERAEKNTAD